MAEQATSEVPDTDTDNVAKVNERAGKGDGEQKENDTSLTTTKVVPDSTAHLRPFIEENFQNSDDDNSDCGGGSEVAKKCEEDDEGDGASSSHQIQEYDSFPDDDFDRSSLEDYSDADDDDNLGVGGANDEGETIDREDVTAMSLALSTLEEEIGLNESTLESLSVKMDKLEEEMEVERVKIQSYKENISVLESRKVQLRKARDENANLVRGMESTLRKLVNRLRKKLAEKTEAVPRRDSAVMGAINNEDSSCDCQGDKITENVVPIESMTKKAEANSMAQGEGKLSANEQEPSVEDSMMAVEQHYDDDTDSAPFADCSIDTKESQTIPTEPLVSAVDSTKNEFKEIPQMNTIENIEKMWSCAAEPPAGYSPIRMYTPPLLPTISSEKILRRIIDIATAEVRLASKSGSSDNAPAGPSIWGSCLDICANIGNLSLPSACNNSAKLVSSKPVFSDQNTHSIDPNIPICPYQLSGTCADVHCPYQHLPFDGGGEVAHDSGGKVDASSTKDTSASRRNTGIERSNNNRRAYPLLPKLRLSVPQMVTSNNTKKEVKCVDDVVKEASSSSESKKELRENMLREKQTSTDSQRVKYLSPAIEMRDESMLSSREIACSIDPTNDKKRKREKHEGEVNYTSKNPTHAHDSAFRANKDKTTKQSKTALREYKKTELDGVSSHLLINQEGSTNGDRQETVFQPGISFLHACGTNDNSFHTHGMTGAFVAQNQTHEKHDESDENLNNEADYISLPSLSSKDDIDTMGSTYDSEGDHSEDIQNEKDGVVSTAPQSCAVSDSTPFWWWEGSDTLHDLTTNDSGDNSFLIVLLSAAGFTVRKIETKALSSSKKKNSVDNENLECNFNFRKYLEHVPPSRPTQPNDDTLPFALFDQRLIRFGARVLDCARLCVHAGRYDLCNAITSICADYLSNNIPTGSFTNEVKNLLCTLMGHVYKLVAITNCSKNAFDTFKCQMSLALLAEWIFAFDCDYLGEYQNDIGISANKGNLNADDSPPASRRKATAFWNSLLDDCVNIFDEITNSRDNLEPLYSLVSNQTEPSRHSSSDQWFKLLRSTIRSCLTPTTGGDKCCAGSQLQHLLDCVRIGRVLSEDILCSLQETGSLSHYTILQMFLEPIRIEVFHHVRSLSNRECSIRYLDLIALVVISPAISCSLSYLLSSFAKEHFMATSVKENGGKILYHLDSRAYATMMAVDTFLYRTLRTIHQLGGIAEGRTMSDLLFAPMYALSISLPVLLGIYNEAQFRLERAFSEWSFHEKCRADEEIVKKTQFCQLFEDGGLLGFSELLWSQLVQLRISFPVDSDTEEKHEIANMIFQFGVHPHHLYLQGDQHLVRRARVDIFTDKNEKSLNYTQIFEQSREACFAVTSLVSLPDRLLDSIFELESQDGDVLLRARRLITRKEYENNNNQANVCSLVLSNVPMNLRIASIPTNVYSLFPLSIFLLGNALTHLSLMHCHLHSIPQTFGMWLSNLETLNISHNDLPVLPESLCMIGSLKEMDVSSNKLVRLPERIGQMKCLCRLSAACNQLDILPVSLSKCTLLKYLDLSRNLIHSMPSELPLKLFNLKTLLLDGNPVTTSSDDRASTFEGR